MKKTRFDNTLKSISDVDRLGKAIGLSLAQAQYGFANAVRPTAFKEDSINVNPHGPSIYGRNSIFDPCSSGDIFGLQVQTIGLMPWIGWRPNKYYRRRVDFIPWWGPEGTTQGRPKTGAGSPCDDPYTWEYGTCGYDLVHTSWYHLQSEGLDPHTIVQERCETSPRYRLNGVQIMDDVEWQTNGIMNVLAQQIRHALVHGSHDNPYEMNGLEQIIKSEYLNDNGTVCTQIGSSIIDWKNDDLDGEGNGLGNFFDYLDELVTDIEYRAQDLGPISETDMILLTSRFMATCLLDSYACYTTCGVTNNSDITDQALRAQQRAARMALNGGPLYDGARAVGYLNLKSGRRIPIVVEDALDISKFSTSYCTDIYLLTRRIGSVDVMYGEFLDLRTYENRVRKQWKDFGVRADAAGRFAFKGKEDNWCLNVMIGTSPEIYIAAPWAQVRIQDVCCTRKRTPLTGDPFQPIYMPGGHPLHIATPDV